MMINIPADQLWWSCLRYQNCPPCLLDGREPYSFLWNGRVQSVKFTGMDRQNAANKTGAVQATAMGRQTKTVGTIYLLHRWTNWRENLQAEHHVFLAIKGFLETSNSQFCKWSAVIKDRITKHMYHGHLTWHQAWINGSALLAGSISRAQQQCQTLPGA